MAIKSTPKRTLIVGNWKMHLNTSQSSLLLHRLHERIKIRRDIELVLAPSMLVLQPLSLQIDRRKFRLAAQNAYHQDEGAYTGEVSFTMLRDLVHYVIVGHSERRYKFNEGLPEIKAKVAAAVRNDITPILCVGETAQEKEDKETKQILHDQVTTALANLTAREVEKMVIAYEPVWALSTGTDYLHHATPKPGDIAEAIRNIRHNVAHLYGERVAKRVRVLYGGSVNATTARGFLETDGVDGLLVGGASLNYHEFSNIIAAADRSLAETKQTP